MRMTLLSFALFGLAACQAEAPPAAAPEAAVPPANAPAPDATPAPTAGDAANASAGPAAVLAGNVWRVERRSDGGEVGATYAFLADGTLVVDSPGGTPLTGSWRAGEGGLSLTEEGVAYPTELVVRDADHVTLRSHNPGGVVELALVRAPEVPLPGG